MTVTHTPATEEPLSRLPKDGNKYELVSGEIRQVPTGDKHDAIVALIIYLLYPFTRGRGMVCASQAGFRMASGNVRVPDVSFTRKERLPDGVAPAGFGDFAPDLCTEVIPPSEVEAESLQKVAAYFASRAAQVWHAYPDSQRVVIFTSPTASHVYESGDELPGGDLLPGFHHPVSDLFAVD